MSVAEIYTDGACRGNPGPGGWALKRSTSVRVFTDSEYVRRGRRWVKGHSGVPGNERADLLANQAIDALVR